MIAQIIDLPKITDPRGNLTFIEEMNHVPFQISRTYWIYDVPGGERRGGHAFKEQQEILVALSGSFDVVVSNGECEERHTLNRSYYGLYVPLGSWRHIENFSTNAVCLVLSSEHYHESDYIRNWDEFLQFRSEYVSVKTTTVRETTKPITRNKVSVNDCLIRSLPKIQAGNGHLSIVEGAETLPYDIRRAYYLYDIPASSERGAHAHKDCHRFLVAVSGSFDVELDDGVNKKTVRLDRPYYGLYVPPGVWTAIDSFSGGAVCLSLASDLYEENDYIRDYSEYLEYCNA